MCVLVASTDNIAIWNVAYRGKMTTLFASEVAALTIQLCTLIQQASRDEQITLLNSVRQSLHAVSPFRDEPVDCVLWLASDRVGPNDYNPNTVAPPEMRLLKHSIQKDGYTQPIVGSEIDNNIEVVDGAHRTRVGKEDKMVRERVYGYLPVVLIRSTQHNRRDRMAATIRHNRARGTHGIDPMRDMIKSLIEQGWNDLDIAQELGMDSDEVLRFKQLTGLRGLFQDRSFGQAWEP